ncbi:preprotein translocase subunit SecY [archaeon CG10_big_fil_rev_8_21_14_0_10_43_11]|nr:MAG: preprotein translocase subunit SecY [archaeon CG10_big_fil_rev_8_21_14_0_10_43_11]
MSWLSNLPEIKAPTGRINLNSKLMWTLAALVIYFILGSIPIYGLSPAYKSQFETLAILLAANFGSLLSLGIGPIVTASIILQLLQGAGVFKIDTSTPEGKAKFQGLQKVFGIVFIVFENALYVMSGALPSADGSPFTIMLMIVQLIVAGLVVLYLDELVSKYGVGSGISLFIAAGVSAQIFANGLSPLPDPTNPSLPTGQVWKVLALFLQGQLEAVLWPLVSIVATIVVFGLSVYLQATKVEIPLSFGRVRGHSIKWPLKFIYTSNIPVILVAALIASMQFWGLMMFNLGIPLLGSFEPSSDGQMVAASGLVKYMNPPTLRKIILAPEVSDFISFGVYLFMMSFGAMFFSILWVMIGNQDPGTVADQILSSNLQIPGFRRDKRIITRMLARYITPLTVLGGLSVGILAAVADLLGALSRGTGILLSVMIVYGMYEQISRESMEDANPLIRKLLK